MVLTDKGKKIAIFQAIFFTIVILERCDIFYYIWHQEGENLHKITVFSSDS